MIGLPRKNLKVVPVVFENMLPEQKEKLLVSWFVEAHEALALPQHMGRKIIEDLV